MFVISILYCDNRSSTHVHAFGFLELMHAPRMEKNMASAGDHRKMRSSLTCLSASCTATIPATLMCMYLDCYRRDVLMAQALMCKN